MKSMLITVITMILAIAIGWSVSPYITGSERLPHNDVKNVSDELAEYNRAVSDYFIAQLDTTLTPARLESSKERLSKSVKNLNQALEKAQNKYGKSLQAPINAFSKWEKTVDYSDVSNQSRANWSKAFSEKSEVIMEALQIASKTYDVDNPEATAIMRQVAPAKEALKNHPNDPKLCTVMKTFPADMKKIKLTAQRVAFIDSGDKYCSDYYYERNAWGKVGQPYSGPTEEIPYSTLTYSDYYQNKILPQMDWAIEQYRTQAKQLCASQNIKLIQRDPKQDALRVALQKSSASLCPPKTKLEQYNFNDTSYNCIIISMWRCQGSQKGPCDVIERCKPKAGPVFDD